LIDNVKTPNNVRSRESSDNRLLFDVTSIFKSMLPLKITNNNPLSGGGQLKVTFGYYAQYKSTKQKFLQLKIINARK
jgi:hypothetical protein